MIVVITRGRIAPGADEAMRAALDAVVAPSLAEDGCLSYGFFADVFDDRSVVCLEEWRDQSALDDHMARDHTAAFIAAAPDIFDQTEMAIHEVA